MAKEIIVYLLRSGENNPAMRDRFPLEKDTLFVRMLKCLRVGKFFHYCVNALPRWRKIKVYNFLINRFRIPWLFVPPRQLEEKYSEAIAYLKQKYGNQNIGDYLEFGVFQGTSMLCLHRALHNSRLDDVRLFGFDSFQGLPPVADQDESGRWTAGEFKADIQFTKEKLDEGNVDWKKTFLIEGYFSATLTKNLIDHYQIKKASIIMIDSDTYLSAKEALTFCHSLINNEAIIFFDDWNSTDNHHGEKRAFREFLDDYNDLVSEDFGSYDHNSKVFKVIRKNKGK